MEPERALPPSVAAALERLDALVHDFETHPEPTVQARVAELLQCVDTVHRAGLRQLGELLKVAGLQRRALDDPEVRLLFDLYDLGEGGEQQRAEAVLDQVRPYLSSHGGGVEILGVEGGVVSVRLIGACHGCDGSAATLRQLIEQTLREGLADFERLEVQESVPLPAGFIPLASIRPVPRLTWTAVLRADEVPPGTIRGVEVADEQVLVANLDGEYYAYQNACPGSPFPLDMGLVEGHTLRCPWHACRFDLRGGRRLDAPGPGLGVMPIAVENGEVRIGVLAAGASA